MQSWRQYQQIRRSVQQEVSALQSGLSNNSRRPSALSGQTAAEVPSQSNNVDSEKVTGDQLHQQSTNLQAECHGSPRDIQDKESFDKDPGMALAQGIGGVTIRRHNGKTLFVVEADDQNENDICNPQRWTRTSKWVATIIVSCAGAVVGWGSSIDSGALDQGMEEFGVSDVAQSLTTGLFLIAFGLGTLIAASSSETIGRNATYISTLALFCCFVLGSALAPNYGGLLVLRFISGFFGATPLVTVGGTASDMWSASDRTYVFPLYGIFSFLGPFMAPMVGSFIGQSPLISWRWVYWITLIFGGLVLGSILLFMPETYQTQLLSWKAKHLRELTGDARYKSSQELEDATFLGKLRTSILRPIDFFLHEPMVVLFALYLVVVYIVLFGFLTGYPFIFGDVYGFSQGSIGLCYIGVNIGFLFALTIVMPLYKKYMRDLGRAKANGQDELPPENRLIFARIGAPLLPISLFWMAWTSYPSISYWSCLIATVPLGFATQTIFISTYQYLIDTYTVYSSSALVACALLRYIAAGVMVPVTIPMYKNLGHHWALTLLALLSTLATAIPYIFQQYGARIRSRSRSAQQQG